MTIKTFIEKASGGGWKPKSNIVVDAHDHATYGQILLDPLAWQAVGKSLWGEGYIDPNAAPFMEEWKRAMHRMIDALAEGKTIEEFIATL